MKIKIFNKNIILPKKSHLPDAGFDCFLPIDLEIKPGETVTIPLGFGVQIPDGYCGIFIPRSSIAEKGLLIQTSAVDCDYVGEVHLIATNTSNEILTFKKNDRLTSLICVNILNTYLEVVDELPKSSFRGEKGLGSTGR